MQKKDGLRGNKTSVHPVLTCLWMCSTISAALLPNTLPLWFWLVFWSCWSFLSHSRWLNVGMINPHSNKQPFGQKKLLCCPHPPCVRWHQQCLLSWLVLAAASASQGLCCCPNVIPKATVWAGGWVFFLLYYQTYPWNPLSAHNNHTAPSIYCESLVRR